MLQIFLDHRGREGEDRVNSGLHGQYTPCGDMVAEEIKTVYTEQTLIKVDGTTCVNVHRVHWDFAKLATNTSSMYAKM